MPEIRISVGGRSYEVSCQEGEEGFLRAAAAMLDAEAVALGPQASRIPEARLLLMSGLMLADKTAGTDDQVRAAAARLDAREAEIEGLREEIDALRADLRRADEALGRLAGLAERAEALADRAEAG